MTSGRNRFGAGLLLAIAGGILAPIAYAQYTFAAPQGIELWGGPAAKGAGAAGARYDTKVTVSAILSPATGTVDYWAGGTLRATLPFTLGPRGVAVLDTPAALEGAGAFLYHVTSTTPVVAFSETYNDSSSGRYGVSLPAFTTSDFLTAGDEASGGGAEDSTSATAARTNVGVLCGPNSALECKVEVGAFSSGSLLGVGTITAVPGSAVQASLSALVAAASGRTGVNLQIRMLQGQGQPYAIRNDNRTSDGTQVPLAVARGVFSTAPVIESFTATPTSGCSPLSVTLAWATTGAAKVSVSGVTGDLPANGTTTVTLNTSAALVLTATSPTGATSTTQRNVTVNALPAPPTPSPTTAQVGVGGNFTGLLPPAPAGTMTAAFVQQQSTGSSFVISGNSFLYTAGSVAGTDIVRITLASACGNVTADFTATVLPPGLPKILSFTADPPVGCNTTNVVLTWTTLDATSVTITPSDYNLLAPNGSVGVIITAPTTFTLTARGANNSTSKTTLHVPVDTALPTPVLTPSTWVALPYEEVYITVSNVPAPTQLRIVPQQVQSGGTFRMINATQFRYVAGPIGGGAIDMWRVYDSNGCGFAFATFQAQVNWGP